MATASRDVDGVWTVTPEEGDHPPYNDWLTRHLSALDPLFTRARKASEFDFALSLLRVRGHEATAFDPYETTLRGIPKIRDLWDVADTETRKHVGLWLYGHILEASEPYELLANMIRIASGGKYMFATAFPPRGNRTPSPGEKIRTLHESVQAAGLPGTLLPLQETWDRHLRNAAFHADYAVSRRGLRTTSGDYPWERYDHLVNGALAYHDTFSRLYKAYLGSFQEPTKIAVPEYFAGQSGEFALTMVRQEHGLIGVKDALTPEQIRRGEIPFRLGRFTADEIKMIDVDPTRTLFPPATVRAET